MRRLVCLLSCAAVVMLAACSDPQASPPPEQEESVGATSESPEETATSSPDDAVETTSPTAADREDPGVPELPPEAMEDTEAGAEAFVQYYVDLLNYTAQFPQQGLLDDLADPECGTCETFEARVTEQLEADTHYDGPSSVVQEVDALPSGSGYRVYVRAEAPAYRRIDASGAEIESVEKGQDAEVAFDIYSSQGSFIVEAVRTIGS